MKLPVIAFFSVVSLLLGGCATKPSQPDWIAGESAKYQSAQYLTGRGQAGTQEEAKDRARADLAKVFQVAVAADSEDVQSFRTDPEGGAGQYEGQSSRRISTSTEQIVRGILIPELWQDPVTKNHHALAVLPRLQAAASLRQQVTLLDDAIKNNIEQSRKNTDLFLKIAAASRALDIQLEREGLQKSLQIVDLTGRGVETQLSSAKFKSDLDDLLKRVRIASQVSNDSQAGFADVISGALAQAGFMIETGDRPDFSLKSRLNLSDMGLVGGWYWQRGTLEITLTEVGSGRIRGTKRWPIKSSATDRETAVKRALDQADEVLKKELGDVIINMAISR
jgi:hypothetical protein